MTSVHKLREESWSEQSPKESDDTRCCTNTIVLLKMSTVVLETCRGYNKCIKIKNLCIKLVKKSISSLSCYKSLPPVLILSWTTPVHTLIPFKMPCNIQLYTRMPRSSSGLFLPGSIKSVYTFVLSPIHDTCPTLPIVHNFNTWIIFGEKYKWCMLSPHCTLFSTLLLHLPQHQILVNALAQCTNIVWQFWLFVQCVWVGPHDKVVVI